MSDTLSISKVLMRIAIVYVIGLLIAGHSLRAGDSSDDAKPIPAKFRGETEVALLIERRENGSQYDTVVLTLINPTKNPISYAGYAGDPDPRLITRRLDGNKWVESVLECGVGLEMRALSPERCMRMKIQVGNKQLPTHYGANYIQKDGDGKRAIVWSEVIETSAAKTISHFKAAK